MSEEPWLFKELERAAAEFRAMPDEYKPVVTDGRQRLARTTPDAAVPGPGDRVYQPTLWDGDSQGASTEILTQTEKDSLLLRMWHGDD